MESCGARRTLRLLVLEGIPFRGCAKNVQILVLILALSDYAAYALAVAGSGIQGGRSSVQAGWRDSECVVSGLVRGEQEYRESWSSRCGLAVGMAELGRCDWRRVWSLRRPVC